MVQKIYLVIELYWINCQNTAKSTQFNYQLSIDDKTYSGETTMILTANGPFIGGSRIPLTDLSPQDGELNTFILMNKVSVF